MVQNIDQNILYRIPIKINDLYPYLHDVFDAHTNNTPATLGMKGHL